MIDQKEKPIKKRRFKIKKFLFLVIILIFFFLSYFVLTNSMEWRSHLNNKEQEEVTKKALVKRARSGGHTPEAEPPGYYLKSIDNKTQHNPTTAASHPLIDQDSEDTTTKTDEDSIENSEEINSDKSNLHETSIDVTKLEKQLTNYRMFLKNADKLITSYYMQQDLSKELEIFKQHTYPKKISKVINYLHLYTVKIKELNNDNTSTINYDSWKSKLLSKLFKIKKITPRDDELLKLEEDINQQITTFKKYIYSQNLQDSFINL